MPFPLSRSYPPARTYPARRAYPSSRLYPGEIPTFPAIQIDFFDVYTNVSPGCVNYQLADYDPTHGPSGAGQVLFYPNGPAGDPTGFLLWYDPGANGGLTGFGPQSSWDHVDLTTYIPNPTASGATPVGFGGGFMDGPTYQYAYLCPSKRLDTPTTAAVISSTTESGGNLTALTFQGGLPAGLGYTVAPTITLSEGGATFAQQATVSCQIDGLGRISSYTITNPGGYYTSNPSAAVAPGVTMNSLAVQINLATLAQNRRQASNFQSFDLLSMANPPAKIGSFQGVYCPADGYVYYCPSADKRFPPGSTSHGNFLRYNPAGAGGFSNALNWDWVDLTQNNVNAKGTASTLVDVNAKGMQSLACVGQYIYLIPYGLGYSPASGFYPQLVRFDTSSGDFYNTSGTAYAHFNVANLDPVLLPNGYTGGVPTADGTRLVMVPWKDSSIVVTPSDSTAANLCSVALCHHVAGALSDPTQYEQFNLLNLSPNALGYEFGWRDKAGLIWFVTTGIYNPQYHQNLAVPIVCYNPALPFTQPSSWAAYADPGQAFNPPQVWLPPSAGAAYIPSQDAALWACWASANVPTPPGPPLEYGGTAPISGSSNGIVVRIRGGR